MKNFLKATAIVSVLILLVAVLIQWQKTLVDPYPAETATASTGFFFKEKYTTHINDIVCETPLHLASGMNMLIGQSKKVPAGEDPSKNITFLAILANVLDDGCRIAGDEITGKVVASHSAKSVWPEWVGDPAATITIELDNGNRVSLLKRKP